jgi:hypothetical protein
VLDFAVWPSTHDALSTLRAAAPLALPLLACERRARFTETARLRKDEFVVMAGSDWMDAMAATRALIEMTRAFVTAKPIA